MLPRCHAHTPTAGAARPGGASSRTVDSADSVCPAGRQARGGHQAGGLAPPAHGRACSRRSQHLSLIHI
eukprot:9065602-Alexandrium_andersonii.AAC.1